MNHIWFKYAESSILRKYLKSIRNGGWKSAKLFKMQLTLYPSENAIFSLSMRKHECFKQQFLSGIFRVPFKQLIIFLSIISVQEIRVSIYIYVSIYCGYNLVSINTQSTTDLIITVCLTSTKPDNLFEKPEEVFEQ